MKLTDCYLEEDLFPKIFADYEERPYGVLFYSTNNKDSFDSNHAVIYKDKISNLKEVLADITSFYKSKGCRPIIYQSMLDDNWFDEISGELKEAGYKSWVEDQEYMLASGENKIIPNPELTVFKVDKWSDEIENVFLEAEEPWEIKHRRMGAGRALFYEYVEWCKQNDIKNIYIWPDGETPKKIYEEGGYKIVEVRKAGRAVFEG